MIRRSPFFGLGGLAWCAFLQHLGCRAAARGEEKLCATDDGTGRRNSRFWSAPATPEVPAQSMPAQGVHRHGFPLPPPRPYIYVRPLTPTSLRHRRRNRTAQQPIPVRACDAEAHFLRGSMKLSDFVSPSSAAPGGFQPECAVPVRPKRMRRKNVVTVHTIPTMAPMINTRLTEPWGGRHSKQRVR